MRFVLTLVTLLLATDPSTPQDWFRLGITRHDAGDYSGALTAFEKAVELKHAAPIGLPLRMARTYARLGRIDDAFRSLRQAIDEGYGQTEQLNAEDDFLPLRTDPRWKELFAAAEKKRHPCRTTPEHRQFDFWLGEWDVEQNGRRIGSSSIQLGLDECVIIENFAAGTYAGKSLSAWDPSEKRWEQLYIDTNPSSRLWIGGMEGERMVMTTEYERGGVKVLDRMTYTKEGADRVRQFIESSTDGGKTWSPGFDGMYVRRK